MIPSKQIQYYCRAIKQTFGLFDHYFIVIDNYEIHMGFYRPGKILPKGTTKNAHLIAVGTICLDCYTELVTNINMQEDLRLTKYYPVLNCESLTMGLSIQSTVSIISIPIIVMFLIKHQWLYALISLLIAFSIILLYSKYRYTHTKNVKCKHLKSF